MERYKKHTQQDTQRDRKTDIQKKETERGRHRKIETETNTD